MTPRLITLFALVLLACSPAQAADSPPTTAPITDPAKPAAPTRAPSAEHRERPPAPSAAPYEGPTRNALLFLEGQSKESLASLAKFLAEHRSEFETLSDSQRAEFFSKQLDRVDPRFASRSHPTSPGDKRPSQHGPTPEVREKYESLSDAGKEKVKNLFRENRDKLMLMSEDQRRNFLEEGFKKISEEDKGGGNSGGDKGSAKPAAPSAAAPKPAKTDK